MRTISSTLLAAQRAASATPHLRVRLYDRDASVARLRWQRWYEGSEPDGPCAAGLPCAGMTRVESSSSAGRPAPCCP